MREMKDNKEQEGTIFVYSFIRSKIESLIKKIYVRKLKSFSFDCIPFTSKANLEGLSSKTVLTNDGNGQI
jgi:NAD/NADP transhydrogenase alpha subunit